jgi:AmmeMemoRadiSam system protein A
MIATDSRTRGATLITIAREAIEADAAFLDIPREWDEAWLRERAASFVTLRLDGDLRGCIGTVDAHRALGDDVAHNAWAAAYRDTRFPPLDPAERARLAIEVSVLSPRLPIEAATEEEALAKIHPGIDGLVLEFSGHHATFLPQVWEGIPDRLEFLSHLRRKARLPMRFWHPGVKLSRYTVEKFI